MSNKNDKKELVTGLALHEQIKQENLRNMQMSKLTDLLSSGLCILFFPIFLIVFIIIGLGSKKK